MDRDKIKIVERLKNKGLITNRDSLNELMALAIQENEKQMEELKKNSINILNSQSIMPQEKFLSLLTCRLEKF
ncbi:hypothetical protein [Aquimarina algiphila]|uniref:Uncharacterized protein n=1 Tax=Aquimarina algiphila TaxID=2047982 RepID=A0A554VPE8_9FLAO|nr:hypothetical protein [Aquimarina algiphila]TSE10343.1 hypothetical protein FOF46_04730 [Aquimarina algiphila]